MLQTANDKLLELNITPDVNFTALMIFTCLATQGSVRRHCIILKYKNITKIIQHFDFGLNLYSSKYFRQLPEQIGNFYKVLFSEIKGHYVHALPQTIGRGLESSFPAKEVYSIGLLRKFRVIRKGIFTLILFIGKWRYYLTLSVRTVWMWIT